MIIPMEQIEADTLDNLIQAFVLREGTDYGETEYSMQEKVAQVKQQLINKQAVIVYSELHESVDIVPADQFPLPSE
ncbi:YheU family protein [Neptunicella marina]|uniref:YheU family protein n=1 Tax=Neptunicella marina TaxID=2125989 RepID=A0A8J6ISH0_9ALTE|nr:YheU family protein [Neptunicella marina]MBC3765946.1 YheU family protein [Neptunicella marina]